MSSIKPDNVVAIVDCNSFYASCEKVFNPQLNNRPVVVLSNNDGCVVACSQEAKNLGIKIGTPVFKCERLLKIHGGEIFSSNYTLYGDMSKRVMEILSGFSPDMEIYSIDEAFLSLEGMAHFDLSEYGKEIISTVKQWTGLPVSVGIAETKTLAKIGNRFSKRDPSLNGVCNLVNNSHIEYILEGTDVSDVWGVGDQYTKRLKQYGITNALQLRDADEKWIKNKMTITGLRTVMELRGKPCIGLEEAPLTKKGIMSSKSFGKPVESLDEMMEAISVYTSVAAVKLRRQRSVTPVITVFIMTDRFRKDQPQYGNSCTIRLPEATSYTPDLIRFARQGIESIYCTGYLYKKSGVFFGDIFSEDDFQPDLFAGGSMHKIPLMHAIDKINKKYGATTIRTAAEGINNPWQMKRGRLSKKYTTRWDELLNIS